MDHRKRKLDEPSHPHQQQDLRHYPSNKRQYQGGHNNGSGMNGGVGQLQPSDKEPDDANLPVDEIVTFQKKAIYRQMQEYKRLFVRADADLAEARRGQGDCLAKLRISYSWWKQIISELRAICDSLSLNSSTSTSSSTSALKSPTSSSSSSSSPLLESLLTFHSSANMPFRQMEEVVDADMKTSLIDIKLLLESIERGVLKNSGGGGDRGLVDIIKGSSNIDSKIKEVNQSLEDKLANAIMKHEDMQTKLLESSSEINQLKGQLKISQETVSSLESRVSEQQSALTFAEKQVDRLKHSVATISTTTAAASSTNNNDAPNAVTAADASGANSAANTPAATTATVDVDVTDKSAVAANDLQNSIDENDILAKARLKEIGQLRNERILMQQEIQDLKFKLSSLPDEVVKESVLCASLSMQVGNLTNLNAEYTASLKKMMEAVEEVEGERQEMKAKLFEDAKKHNQQYLDRIRHQETDLARIRKDREKYIHDLAHAGKLAEVKLTHFAEIAHLSNSRADRIMALESALSRFKMAVAEGVGDRELVTWFAENWVESDGGSVGGEGELKGNPFTFWKAKVREAEDRAEEYQIKLKAIQESANGNLDKQKLMESELLLQKQVSSLKERVAELESFIGLVDGQPVNSDDKGGKEALLAEQLRKECEKVKELALKVELGEKTMIRLSDELESYNKAQEALDKQNNSKIMDLKSKEEKIARLVAEKSKFDHKCSLLTKQNTTLNNLMGATKKQLEKQLEQIRKFEELEKNVRSQLQLMEKEKSQIKSSAEMYRIELKKTIDQLNEARDTVGRWKVRLDEAFNSLRERTRQAEIEADAKVRAQEQCEVLKKKLESMKNNHSSSSEKTSDMHQRLLRCTACSINLKSHLLIKCMHTFCESCLDDRVKSRQRKCPTCGDPFGVNDVKAFYL